MVANRVMVDNFASFFKQLHDVWSLFNLFQIVGAWPSISVIGSIVDLFVVALCLGFRSPLNPLLCTDTPTHTPAPYSSTDHSKAVPLSQFCSVCASVVSYKALVWHWFSVVSYEELVLILVFFSSPSFDVSGRLIVAFAGKFAYNIVVG